MPTSQRSLAMAKLEQYKLCLVLQLFIGVYQFLNCTLSPVNVLIRHLLEVNSLKNLTFLFEHFPI